MIHDPNLIRRSIHAHALVRCRPRRLCREIERPRLPTPQEAFNSTFANVELKASSFVIGRGPRVQSLSHDMQKQNPENRAAKRVATCYASRNS